MNPPSPSEIREQIAADMSERLKAAVEAYKALDPVDRALHDSDQRRSFVRGQCDREPPRDVLADEVRRLRKQVDGLALPALRSVIEEAVRVVGDLEQIYALNVPLSPKPDHPDDALAAMYIPDTALDWGTFRRAAGLLPRLKALLGEEG